MSKLSNTITLLRLLQNGKKYSIKELSELLEVSPRMIREYKKELEYAGIYIESIRGPYGGYYLNQNIKLPEKIQKHDRVPIDNKEYYNLISKSISNRNKCYIEYYSKEHDKITKRVIRPYELIVLDKEWGVAAYCENKQEIRHFYLNRINKFEILEEKY
ncbi:MAG: WYL domain-containing protein [Firmicutes bacterium]|nr:WYL domain-containing protein [Bacillota bacterium]